MWWYKSVLRKICKSIRYLRQRYKVLLIYNDPISLNLFRLSANFLAPCTRLFVSCDFYICVGYTPWSDKNRQVTRSWHWKWKGILALVMVINVPFPESVINSLKERKTIVFGEITQLHSEGVSSNPRWNLVVLSHYRYRFFFIFQISQWLVCFISERNSPHSSLRVKYAERERKLRWTLHAPQMVGSESKAVILATGHTVLLTLAIMPLLWFALC